MKRINQLIASFIAVNGLGLAAISLFVIPFQTDMQVAGVFFACYLTGMFSLFAGFRLVVK